MNKVWQPKVWVAVLLGIVVQPFVFLYLNKLMLFWLYLLLVSVTNYIDWKYQLYFSFIFTIFCPMHAYLITKNYNPEIMRKWYSKWWGIPAILAVIFSTIFLVRSFLYEPFSVPADSMTPNLETGDVIIVQKFGFGDYGTHGMKLIDADLSAHINVERGKMYAFYPPNLDTPYVKRLIGKPGDRIIIKGNNVFINGLALETNLISKKRVLAFIMKFLTVIYIT